MRKGKSNREGISFFSFFFFPFFLGCVCVVIFAQKGMFFHYNC